MYALELTGRGSGGHTERAMSADRSVTVALSKRGQIVVLTRPCRSYQVALDRSIGTTATSGQLEHPERTLTSLRLLPQTLSLRPRHGHARLVKVVDEEVDVRHRADVIRPVDLGCQTSDDDDTRTSLSMASNDLRAGELSPRTCSFCRE